MSTPEPVPWPYRRGDLVRWIWDPPTGTPPGLVLNVDLVSTRPMVEVWWVDSQRITTLLEEDLVLVSSIRVT